MSDSEWANRVTEQELALDAAEKAFGASSIEAATVLLKLGGAYRSAGRLAEAQRSWVRALEITEETLGPDHVELARIFCCLAELELARGRFLTGESYARRSLEISEGGGEICDGEAADCRRLLAALLAGQAAERNPGSSDAVSVTSPLMTPQDKA